MAEERLIAAEARVALLEERLRGVVEALRLAASLVPCAVCGPGCQNEMKAEEYVSFALRALTGEGEDREDAA